MASTTNRLVFDRDVYALLRQAREDVDAAKGEITTDADDWLIGICESLIAVTALLAERAKADGQ